MESISDIIERKGGYTTVGELSSDSEYRRVLRAVERGEMQKIRHGVYANADALASTVYRYRKEKKDCIARLPNH